MMKRNSIDQDNFYIQNPKSGRVSTNDGASYNRKANLNNLTNWEGLPSNRESHISIDTSSNLDKIFTYLKILYRHS